jgi:hypothetical protein
VGNYQTALRSVTYTNTSDNPSTLTRTVTIVANDGASANNLSAAATRNLTVTPVNDPPSFQKGADVTVAQNSAAYSSVSSWATAISPGPAEAGQAVHFVVNAAKPYLFSIQPAVNPTGILTFTPAPNFRGASTVTAALQDNGGTLNGGVDTSPTLTFLITIGRSADLNGNGLPDDWEQAYFGGTTAVPGQDTDGDGFTNLEEFETGTNPADPSDAPGITATEPSGSDVIIRFKTVPGKSYRVDWSDRPQGGTWTQVGGDVAGTGQVLSATDTNAATRQQSFHRVVVLP